MASHTPRPSPGSPRWARRQLTYAAAAGALLCSLLWSVAPSRALAHPDIDSGVSAADEGLFAKALQHFDAAMQSGELSRDELVQLLRRRVLVQFALRRQQDLDRDLRTLLALEPEIEFGATAPPDLSAHIDRMRSEIKKLQVRVEIEDLPGGLRVATQVEGLPEGAGFKAEIGMRAEGGPWQRSSGGELRYPASPGAEIEFYAVVVGPGNVVVAGEGSEAAPAKRTVALAAASAAPVVATPTDEPNDDRSRRRLWWGVGGAVAVVAIALAVGIGASGGGASDTDSDVQAPMVTFP